MWVYWIRLYESKFQASCVVQRMENDYWMYNLDSPKEIEIFKSLKGRYGVKYLLSNSRN